jgi:hypothetical protein
MNTWNYVDHIDTWHIFIYLAQRHQGHTKGENEPAARVAAGALQQQPQTTGVIIHSS